MNSLTVNQPVLYMLLWPCGLVQDQTNPPLKQTLSEHKTAIYTDKQYGYYYAITKCYAEANHGSSQSSLYTMTHNGLNDDYTGNLKLFWGFGCPFIVIWMCTISCSLQE